MGIVVPPWASLRASLGLCMDLWNLDPGQLTTTLSSSACTLAFSIPSGPRDVEILVTPSNFFISMTDSFRRGLLRRYTARARSSRADTGKCPGWYAGAAGESLGGAPGGGYLSCFAGRNPVWRAQGS